MKTVELSPTRSVVLPKGLFRPLERVVLFTESNMVIIKKLEPPQASSLAQRKKTTPPSLRAIAKEVHAYRRAKRA